MDDKFEDAAILGAIGLAAGLAGAVAMLLGQRAEIAVTKRAPSAMPARALEKTTGIALDDAEEEWVSTAAHLAFGTGLGLGLAALAQVPEPARGLLFLGGSWTAGNALVTGLGLSDPPWTWSARELATDIGHHIMFAAAAAATFLGLRRLARV